MKTLQNFVNGKKVSATSDKVQDLINPVLNLQDITVNLNANGVANLTPAMIDNGFRQAASVHPQPSAAKSQ